MGRQCSTQVVRIVRDLRKAHMLTGSARGERLDRGATNVSVEWPAPRAFETRAQVKEQSASCVTLKRDWIVMKNLLRCPKCASKRIWVIEKYRVPGESADGRELPVVPHQPDPAASKSVLGAQWGRVRPLGHFDLFVCDGCGYSELWADGFRGLTPDPSRGIKLIDTTNAKDGPFR